MLVSLGPSVHIRTLSQYVSSFGVYPPLVFLH